MNAKLKKLKAQIEKAGGQLMISDDIPDDLVKMLTRSVADCPDCAAAMLASSRKQRRSRHEH